MSSMPPLYPNDPDNEESHDSFGRAGRKPFRGIMDFGRRPGRTFRGFGLTNNGNSEDTDPASWDAEYNRMVDQGVDPTNAAILADVARPFAHDTAVGRAFTAAQATKAASDATWTQIAKLTADNGTQLATAAAKLAAEQAARDIAAGRATGTGIDPTTGQLVKLPPKPADNTMMYVGAAAVVLGLAFVALKKKGGGGFGYARRTRKNRKSRK